MRERKHDSPYEQLWTRLHIAAAQGADQLFLELESVAGTISCNYCRAHLQAFDSEPRNQHWKRTNPEFYVYKLHTAANHNARLAKKRSSLPPPYGRTIALYRRLAQASDN